ncbi:MAG: 50S ribosomal protein L29 [Candidatus Yanofskybacteria bacterium CG10_big_fil_rev_8_21_14_0_10_46_23]|uniref:Large ribosomal subunit protein uL29 n=1 Tax=Candidatus Yanofskybacteria bacterium CG10_big_fil_rev_8_21_14_0_10_46_23 TaxID=1975098 RepID=A0A2H0R5W5_9BACT|nr:MAG: 50S ribosomal protein L29 [Candidatus Yanofskybacteria bacterium CG10_big_fil_rev_8_21_14_0_10_46_23]
MKYQDLKNKTLQEMNDMVKDLVVRLGELRFNKEQGAVKNLAQINLIKKDIARLKLALSLKHES